MVTPLSLLLLSVHVESEGERRLAEAVSLSLELLELALVDTAELEQKTSSGGRLTRVDVTADDDRDVLLAVRSHCSVVKVTRRKIVAIRIEPTMYPSKDINDSLETPSETSPHALTPNVARITRVICTPQRFSYSECNKSIIRYITDYTDFHSQV